MEKVNTANAAAQPEKRISTVDGHLGREQNERLQPCKVRRLSYR